MSGEFQVEGLYREGEETIAKSCWFSSIYSKNKLRGRFKTGEDVIAEDGGLAVEYAVYILKKRWRKAEKSIKECGYWDLYKYELKKIDITI